MQFIDTNLETILGLLSTLDASTQPAWGKMSAQRMVEHLSESIDMSMGLKPMELLIPEEKIEKMQAILSSDTPMPRDFKAPFAPENVALRHDEIELAIDELVENWINFEEYYELNPSTTNLHPFYGALTGEQWLRMHQKHFTHHFQQFGLIEG